MSVKMINYFFTSYDISEFYEKGVKVFRSCENTFTMNGICKKTAKIIYYLALSSKRIKLLRFIISQIKRPAIF